MRVVMSDVEWYYGRYVLAGIIVLVGVCGGMGIYYYEWRIQVQDRQASGNSSDTSQEVSHFLLRCRQFHQQRDRTDNRGYPQRFIAVFI
jgi:hypothetical protein